MNQLTEKWLLAHVSNEAWNLVLDGERASAVFLVRRETNVDLVMASQIVKQMQLALGMRVGEER